VAAHGTEKRVYQGSSFGVDVVNDLVIQGVVTQFDKPLIHGSEILILKTGCFDESLRTNDVSFFLDHKDAGLGTTANRLEVHAGKEALVFRYDIPSRNRASDEEKQLAELAGDLETYLPCSIGFTRTKCETRTIDGVQVVTVIEGTLREVSLLSCSPAVHSTYSRVASKDTCGTLEHDYQRIMLVGRVVGMHRAVKAAENGGNVEYAHVTNPYDRAAANFTRSLKALT
jgi:hypothetical protein